MRERWTGNLKIVHVLNRANVLRTYDCEKCCWSGRGIRSSCRGLRAILHGRLRVWQTDSQLQHTRHTIRRYRTHRYHVFSAGDAQVVEDIQRLFLRLSPQSGHGRNVLAMP